MIPNQVSPHYSFQSFSKNFSEMLLITLNVNAFDRAQNRREKSAKAKIVRLVKTVNIMSHDFDRQSSC